MLLGVIVTGGTASPKFKLKFVIFESSGLKTIFITATSFDLVNKGGLIYINSVDGIYIQEEIYCRRCDSFHTSCSNR